MGRARRIRVGLIGLGTVGSGVAQMLLGPAEKLLRRSGVEAELRWACDVDRRRARALRVPRENFTTDYVQVLDDPEVDVVVELIGGTTVARRVVMNAVRRGKHVITANKALLAAHGDEIFGAARKKGVGVAFEGSVGGGTPVIRALREGFAGNKIKSILGIVNGTCNYVLTKMSQAGWTYKRALAEAQREGFAEKDPALDVSGGDSAHKLTILARLAFCRKFRLDAVHVEGIEGLEAEDIGLASEFGYVVKLLAIGKSRRNGVELRVHPTLLPTDHPLASVKDTFNAIMIEGDRVGRTMFYGQGAGQMPTATAILADIVDVALGRAQASFSVLQHFSASLPEGKTIGMDEVETKYFLRFMAMDRPGVLARISGILGRKEISIASVIQKGRRRAGPVPIVMLTHKAAEGRLRQALRDIDRLTVLREKTVLLRVEEDGER